MTGEGRYFSRKLTGGVLGVALCSTLLYAALLLATSAYGATSRSGTHYCGRVVGGLWAEGLPDPGPNDTGHTYAVSAYRVPCSFARPWAITWSKQYSKCMQADMKHPGSPCHFRRTPGFRCVPAARSPDELNPGGRCTNDSAKHPKGFSWALFHTQG